MSPSTRLKLQTAAVNEDKRLTKQEVKRGLRPNIWRMGHYLAAIQGIDEDVDNGITIERSIAERTNGRFENLLRKAVGLSELDKMGNAK